MKTRLLTIFSASVVGFVIILLAMTIFGNNISSIEVTDSSSKHNLEKNAEILSEINRHAIIYQKNNEQEKFDEQAVLMQETLGNIASDSLGMDIFMSDVFEAYFPLVAGSQVEIHEGVKPFQTCNVVENIPIHLQKIRNAKMFQMFAEKYSDYPIELFLQDERMYESLFHYGFIAKSGDGKSALTYFHVNSCTNEVTDLDNYFLSCHDEKQNIFGTKNRNDILASLNHDEFCIIPLDEWRQSVYDYSKTIKEKIEKHIPKAETMDRDYETVKEYESEIQRLRLLSDITGMIVMGTHENKDIQEKIKQYNKVFGSLPDEFLKLIENRK